MRMTLEEYTQVMDLLSAVHGEEHAVFTNPDISAIWYEFFASKTTAASFRQIMKWYLSHCHWMPKAPNDIYKAWIESGEQRPPGEDWNALNAKIAASLPSSEYQEQVRQKEELDNMSPEQREENLLRFQLIYAITHNLKKQNGVSTNELNQIKDIDIAALPIHELQAILKTCKKQKQISKLLPSGQIELTSNSLLEDLRKYFHSGSERYRQAAINRAIENGFELITKDGQIVDIAEVEF